MTSLVLLKRTCPDGVYLACGDQAEVLEELSLQKCGVEVVAELPHMGHALEKAKTALGVAPCQNEDYKEWYAMCPGAALQALGVLFGAAKPTRSVQLGTQDRNLLQETRDTVAKAVTATREAERAMRELTQEDRNRTHSDSKELKDELQQIKRLVLDLTKDALWAKTKAGMGAMRETTARPMQPSCVREPTFFDLAFQHKESAPPCQKNMGKPKNGKTNPEKPRPHSKEVAIGHEGEFGMNEGPNEVEDSPMEPQRHKIVTRPQPNETSMAETQEEFTVTMPLQVETTSIEPQPCHEPQASAEQVEWKPCVAIEERYDDLSDLSSIDGGESPPHKQLKEYVAERRAARKRQVAETSHAQPMTASGALLQPKELTQPELAKMVPSHDASVSTELVPCAKQEAEAAAYIRQALRQKLGTDEAEAVLARCQQKVMRSQTGKLQRYWVDAAGSTLRLAQPKNVALE